MATAGKQLKAFHKGNYIHILISYQHNVSTSMNSLYQDQKDDNQIFDMLDITT